MNQGVGLRGNTPPFPGNVGLVPGAFPAPGTGAPGRGGGGGREWAVWKLRAWGGDRPAQEGPSTHREGSVAAGCGVALGALRSLATSGPQASLGG